jgi:hypothetical protein
MTLRLVDTGWGTELTDALRADKCTLRIVSPFIKDGALKRLLALKPKTVEVITRFNLADFAESVSDITALRRVLNAGGRVRGIRNLHAKLYLFGASRAIVTSANLTGAALDRNAEFGAVLQDAAGIATCGAYFDDLWAQGGSDLTHAQLDDWEAIVTRHRSLAAGAPGSSGLCDFGADAGLGPTQPVTVPAGSLAHVGQAFVKFLGMGSDRVALTYPTLKEIERAGCHRTLAYPKGKRPSGVEEGAEMFIGRLTREAATNDIRIFGRAFAHKHEPGVDDATLADITRRDWRATWPHYVRVHHAEFLAGTMAGGVSLNELMAALEVDAFAATQRNRQFNHDRQPAVLKNENPRTAFMQQPAVRLSREGRAWVATRLQAAFEARGTVPDADLDGIG